MSFPIHVDKSIVDFLDDNGLSHPDNTSLIDFEELIFRSFGVDDETKAAKSVDWFVRKDRIKSRHHAVIVRMASSICPRIRENNTTYTPIENAYCAVVVNMGDDMPRLFGDFIKAYETAANNAEKNGMPHEDGLTAINASYTRHLHKIHSITTEFRRMNEKYEDASAIIVARYKQMEDDVAQKIRDIESVHDNIAEKDKIIASLNKKIREKDRYIIKLNAQIREKEAPNDVFKLSGIIDNLRGIDKGYIESIIKSLPVSIDEEFVNMPTEWYAIEKDVSDPAKLIVDGKRLTERHVAYVEEEYPDNEFTIIRSCEFPGSSKITLTMPDNMPEMAMFVGGTRRKRMYFCVIRLSRTAFVATAPIINLGNIEFSGEV